MHRQALLGESPVWDDRTGALWWVDILRGELHRTDPGSGRDHCWRVPTAVGAVALRSGGGLVAAAGDGFCLLDPSDDAPDDPPDDPCDDSPRGSPTAPGTVAPGWLWRARGPATGTAAGGAGLPDETAQWPNGHPARMNDGKCDPAGRFWAGTMTIDRTPGASHLYRLDPDGTVQTALEGVTLSNGIDWSPDGTAMYYIDTGNRTVDAFEYDPTSGEIRDRRTLVAVEDGAGNPDGMTVDADGCLWVVLARGAAVRRYTPEGTLDRVLPMPVAKVTSCAFGGPGLRTLFVTTACVGLSEADLVAAPLSGAVLAVDAGTAGVPPHRFAG